jgi:Fe-S cluster assembly protein SufD
MPNCVSLQNFKSVLNGSASGVFNGRTIVREDSQKTDSKQSNKNLLLSDQALMNSNPQLEIYADDVKCAHGSTTGALDKEALFYMQSRGINKKEATSLLIRGFVSELINDIKNEDVKDYLFKKFDNWLLNNNQ